MGTEVVPTAGTRGGPRLSAARVDVGVSVLLLAAELVALATLSRDRAPLLGVVSCVVVAGSVAMRRRAPLYAALAAVAGLLGYELATQDPQGAFAPVAVVLTFYTLGRSAATERRTAGALLALGVGLTVALAARVAIATTLNSAAGAAAASWLVVAVAPLVVGIGIARRDALSRRLESAAAQLCAEQELSAARASADERNRVARDLHDVVTHSVSVMVVQAGAARLIAERDPAAADRALKVIGDCGRDALVDLRRIVGVLRRDSDRGFGSGAGLADLGRLAERIRIAGVPVALSIESDEKALPPVIDVVAYRVAQEALTNVIKHAGAGATAHVRVVRDADAVTLEVVDTGGAGEPAGAASGHGLVGMRERVTSYGGSLRAGAQPGGGFAVHARIPLAAEVGAGNLQVTPGRRRVPPQLLPRSAWEVTVVLGWLAAMEAEAATSSARQGPWLFNALLVAVMALAAFWRRRSPLFFLAVVGAVAVALSGGLTALDRSTVTGLYSLAVPLFSVATWQSRNRAIAGLVLWTLGASVVALARQAAVGGLAGAAVMGLVVWIAGRIWRRQRILNAELIDTTARLADQRDLEAELAIATERTRIARELHGPVAHGVVSMVVQAEAARNLLDARQPAGVEQAIRSIEHTGRDALTQLRRILGVLRATGGPLDPSRSYPPPQQAPTSVQHRSRLPVTAPEAVRT